jgi:hypothetical protein
LVHSHNETLDPAAELVHLYDRTRGSPEPVLDLSTEQQTLGSLLDVGKELARLAPQLVPLVCTMLVRELGRIPPAEREKWLQAVALMAPPEDDTILRAVLERVPATTVLRWLIERSAGEPEATVKRLQALFHAVSYEQAWQVLDSIREVRGPAAKLCAEAMRILRSKVIAATRGQLERAPAAEANRLLERLRFVGGAQVATIVSKYLGRIAPDDVRTLETALTTLAAAEDRSLLPTFAAYLSHEAPEIRAIAVEAIAAFGSESALAHLEAHVRSKALPLEERKDVLSRMAAAKTAAARAVLRRIARAGLFSRVPRALRAHAAELAGGTDG